MDKSDYKVCTECGQKKHISEFSKSYPNRCKACVAEHTRQVRERAKQEQGYAGDTDNRIETMKARIKVTGEVVDVKPSGSMRISCGAYLTEDGRMLPGTALEFEKAIDWEQRRYEIAKEMLHAIYLDDGNAERQDNSKLGFEYKSLQGSAKEAVRFADALIAELKKGGQNEE